VDCTGAHPLCRRFEPVRVKPNKASIQQKSAGWLALLTVSAFKLTGVNRAQCYAELAVSSLAAAVTIASTHFAYLWRDGQAELACVAWLNTKMVYP